MTDEGEFADIRDPEPMSPAEARREAAKRLGGYGTEFQVLSGPTVDEELPAEVAHPSGGARR